MGENKKLWFKAKLYGWGWTPVTWQGWVITLGYIFLMICGALYIDKNFVNEEEALVRVLPFFIITTAALLLICYKKGEKPEWRWGK